MADAERGGDNELGGLFREAQADSKSHLRDRVVATSD
jgi:hypothetical protein